MNNAMVQVQLHKIVGSRMSVLSDNYNVDKQSLKLLRQAGTLILQALNKNINEPD